LFAGKAKVKLEAFFIRIWTTRTNKDVTHAHAVAALAFSPNGAYLLSGGEESILVIWSIENDQKVFIPRLGSPVAWVSCVVQESLEYVLGLEDGTLLMINAVTQKVVRSISQLKLGKIQSLSKTGLINTPADPDAYPRRERVPLAYHKPSSSIILPSSHPSSLQMYSLSSNRLLMELEISPSNRVSRRTRRH
jgi:NET1-associated nuclear protein 1 (U3 small nucleolar RNA-associated protein 17)